MKRSAEFLYKIDVALELAQRLVMCFWLFFIAFAAIALNMYLLLTISIISIVVFFADFIGYVRRNKPARYLSELSSDELSDLYNAVLNEFFRRDKERDAQ